MNNVPIHVLLVEDSPSDVLLVRVELEESPRFRVTHAERLGEALSLTRQTTFDVVLLDLGLPDSQGSETLRAFRRHAPDLPVLVLTARDDEELALNVVWDGAQDYLVKGQARDGILNRAIRYAIGRHRSERARQTGEELFRSVFEHTNMAMVVTDMANRFVRVNTAFARMFGYSLEEMSNLSMPEITHPDDLAESYARRKEILAGGSSYFQIEKRYIHKDGRLLWGLTNVSLVRGVAGEPSLYIGQVQDITERKRAEEELKRTADLLGAVANGTTDAVFVKDRKGRYLLFNESAARFVGKPVAEVLGKDDTALFDPDDARHVMERDRRVMAGGVTETEEERLTAAGATRIYLATKGPYRDERGEVAGVLGISRDITARKRTEQRLAAQHAVVGILAEAESLAEAAPRILQAVCETTDWEVGGLWVTDRRANVLTCVDLWHAEDENIAEFRDQSRRLRCDPGVGLPGRVWASGQPAWVVDITRDPNFPRAAAATTAGLRGGFAFPILFGNEVLGVAEFFSRESRQPDEEMVRVFGSLGSQIGQFLERQRARKANLLFRALIDRTSDGIEVIDPETGHFLDVNETTCLAHGYARDEFLTLSVRDIDPIVAARSWEKSIERLRQGDFPIFESLHRRKDGSTFPVEISVNAIRLDREYLVAIVRDITERTRAEEALKQAQQRLTHVLASSPAVLFTLEIGDRIQGINWISENLREMLGYAPEDAFRPEWWIENIHPEERDGIIMKTQADLFSPQGRTTHEYRFRHRDGSFRWTRGEIRLIRDAAGEAVEAVGSWSDITERKQLEEQFHQAQKMEAVGRLAGGVAHDFNNLLTIINGYSDIVLERLPAGDPIRGMLEEVRQAGDRSASLTRQLLAFSRQEIVAPRPLDMNRVVTNAGKLLKRIIGEDIRLATALGTNLGTIQADPGQVEQVLMNLAVNARDAMPIGGSLTIETHNVELGEREARIHPGIRPGSYVLLTVTDTGCGMPPEVRARIFEPFFTTKGVGRGTGLGLAVVHGIITQAGGHLEVESQPGAGTTFRIYLPRLDRSVNVVENRTQAPVAPRGTETILLVEDEERVRLLTRRILTGQGYSVLEAGDGAKAATIAERHDGPIALLVTDVVMPGMSGRELAERLRADHPELRVLFVSGYTDDAVVRHGIVHERVPFLQKPFSPLVLAAKVREVLDAPASERVLRAAP